MNIFKKRVKEAARALGFDIVTYRPFLELLEEWGINTVFDVGANEGQFANELRESGFKGVIYSFEPTSKAFAVLNHNSAADANWHAVHCGLGRQDECLTIDLAENSQLNSIFTPLRPHAFSGQETIQLRRFDGWLRERNIHLPSACLKLDVQGYEQEVMEGAGDLLPKFGAVMAELAVTKSYEGQPYIENLTSFMRGKGFDLWITRRGTWTPHGKREIECDGLFRNRAMTAAGA